MVGEKPLDTLASAGTNAATDDGCVRTTPESEVDLVTSYLWPNPRLVDPVNGTTDQLRHRDACDGRLRFE
jgi:hypothetical protein